MNHRYRKYKLAKRTMEAYFARKKMLEHGWIARIMVGLYVAAIITIVSLLASAPGIASASLSKQDSNQIVLEENGVPLTETLETAPSVMSTYFRPMASYSYVELQDDNYPPASTTAPEVETTPDIISTPEPTENLPSSTVEPEPTPEPVEQGPLEYSILDDEEAIVALCKTVWGEFRDPDLDQQAGVVWCVLNRVDDPGYGSDIVTVVTAPHQFTGYRSSNPVTDEIRALVEDVLIRWEREKNGESDVGRVLPSDYLWFYGDSKLNYFRNAYSGSYTIWDWSLPSPYSN